MAKSQPTPAALKWPRRRGSRSTTASPAARQPVRRPRQVVRSCATTKTRWDQEEEAMKFMLFVLPTVPGTLEDRKRLRPIGRNNERYQQMLDELRKLARVRRRRRLRRVRHHRAPFPLRGLRDVGGAAAALRRPGRAHQADQVLAARPGAAGVGSDPRRRGARRPRPTDQGPHLRRLRARLPGPLGQRARPAVPRHGRADGRLAIDKHNRRVYEETLKVIKKAWTEEAWDYDGEYYKVPFPYEEGIRRWPVAEWTRAVRRAWRGRRRGRRSARSASCRSPTSSRIRRCSSRSR